MFFILEKKDKTKLYILSYCIKINRIDGDNIPTRSPAKYGHLNLYQKKHSLCPTRRRNDAHKKKRQRSDLLAHSTNPSWFCGGVVVNCKWNIYNTQTHTSTVKSAQSRCWPLTRLINSRICALLGCCGLRWDMCVMMVAAADDVDRDVGRGTTLCGQSASKVHYRMHITLPTLMVSKRIVCCSLPATAYLTRRSLVKQADQFVGAGVADVAAADGVAVRKSYPKSYFLHKAREPWFWTHSVALPTVMVTKWERMQLMYVRESKITHLKFLQIN